MKPPYTFCALVFLLFLFLFSGSDLLYANKHLPGGKIEFPFYGVIKDTAQPVSAELPGKASREEFKRRALAKIKEFQNCLYILCDKKAGIEAQDNAVDQAANLFVDG